MARFCRIGVTPLYEEKRLGRALFQVTDANGMIVQFVEWVTSSVLESA